MRVNKWFIGLFIMASSVGCIEEFVPDISETSEVLVINGKITDTPGIHSITISKSSPYNDPEFIPVKDCVVRVEDETGNGVSFYESSEGIYSANLNQSFLAVGKEYRLLVFTPDGNEYNSDYDMLLAGAPIQNISFEEEVKATSDPEINYYGIRYFVDVKGEPDESRNYLWTLEETYEYHAAYRTEYIYDNGILEEFVPYTTDWVVCYMTEKINEWHVGSTALLEVNEISKKPLNYVSNQTDRLRRVYCLKVSQHSLSDESFQYWDRMKDQSSETGGLFESQPISSIGNIYNVNDPFEKVLGIFYASQINEKRICVENNFDFIVQNYACPMDTIHSLSELGQDYPYYLISVAPIGGGLPFGYSKDECHDCRLRGGVTTKPDFWEH